MNHEFYVYMLECSDKSYYVGHTDNLEKRLAEHAEGLSSYTSKRLPVKIIYVESFQTRDEAFAAERKIKGWSRKKKEALIIRDFKFVKDYSKKKFNS